ncbi:hypothetical protein GC194_04430 [bacterium]|nr:hypothetical protein [bacterium]
MKRNLIFFFIVSMLAFVASCQTDDEPNLVLSKMQINKISVAGFPNTNNGKDWDIWSSYPDIYVAIVLNGNRFYTSEYYDECVNSNTYNYIRNLPVYVDNYSLQHSIGLWDYDSTSGDEYMGGYLFTPKDYEGKREITLRNDSSEIVLVLSVEWNYKEI